MVCVNRAGDAWPGTIILRCFGKCKTRALTAIWTFWAPSPRHIARLSLSSAIAVCWRRGRRCGSRAIELNTSRSFFPVRRCRRIGAEMARPEPPNSGARVTFSAPRISTGKKLTNSKSLAIFMLLSGSRLSDIMPAIPEPPAMQRMFFDNEGSKVALPSGPNSWSRSPARAVSNSQFENCPAGFRLMTKSSRRSHAWLHIE